MILTARMGDFNKKPGRANLTGDIGTPANVIAPGKRMLSSMSPTIVTKNGKVFMVTGSPGGRTIINTVTEIILNATTFMMDVRQSVDAPRFHHQWLPDTVTFERGAIPDSTAERLKAMGHAIKFGMQQGDGHSIVYTERGVACRQTIGAARTRKVRGSVRRWPLELPASSSARTAPALPHPSHSVAGGSDRASNHRYDSALPFGLFALATVFLIQLGELLLIHGLTPAG